MSNQSRPRLSGDKRKWRAIINHVKEIGLDEAYVRLQESGSWDMVLTKESRDKNGNLLSQQFSRQNAGDTSTEGMRLKRLSKAPNGGEWQIYEADGVSATLYNALKEELSKQHAPISIPKVKYAQSGFALLPMLTDHHFGKMAFSYKEPTWSLNEAREAWQDAMAYHLSAAKAGISRVLLPIGNDLLHTNSNFNTTKRGTVMEVAEQFSKLYSFVRDVVTSSIAALAEIAPVEVIMVQGNHDEDAVYRLGDWLEGRFFNSKAVSVNNKSYSRKYTRYGSTALMFTHGEKVKARDLHSAFSNDMPELFAQTKYRYVLAGHLHKNASQKTAVYSQIRDEFCGTQVEVCPALCPTDRWHFDNNFTGNVRSSKSFHFDKARGRIAEVYYNL